MQSPVGIPQKVNGFEANRCSITYMSGSASDKDDAFAFDLAVPDLVQHFLQAAPDIFLVDLGQFACKAGWPVIAEGFGELFEAFFYPVGGFVEYHCPRFGHELLEFFMPSLFLWKEAFKAETITGQPRGYQCRQEG